MIEGRELLRIAQQLAGGSPSEPRTRSAVNRAYYAAFTEAKDYVGERGFVRKPGRGSHDRVWDYLGSGVSDSDSRRRATRRALAGQGKLLKDLRHKADYQTRTQMGRRDGSAAVSSADAIIKRLDALKP